MKIVINEPKTRKSYQVEKDAPSLTGMKIGDSFDGDIIGLGGWKLQLTGGSDKEGFPMRIEVPGPGRRRLLLTGPPGFHPLKKGQRKRKLVRGNTVSDQIMQLNCKIVEGEGDVALALGLKKTEEPAEEEKPEEKAEEQKQPEAAEEKPAEEKKEEAPAKEEAKPDKEQERPAEAEQPEAVQKEVADKEEKKE